MSKYKVHAISALCGLIFFAVIYALQSQNADFKRIPSDIEKAFASDFITYEFAPDPKTLPAFIYSDLEGVEFSSTDWQGQITIFNLWATFCAPCIEELPYLKALADEFEDIRVIAISMDPGQNTDKITEFMERHSVDPLAAFWDHKREIRKALPARGLPTTYIIGQNGRILYKFEGEADWSSPRAFAFMAAILDTK